MTTAELDAIEERAKEAVQFDITATVRESLADVPALVAEARRLKADNERLREAIREQGKCKSTVKVHSSRWDHCVKGKIKISQRLWTGPYKQTDDSCTICHGVGLAPWAREALGE